MPNTHIARGALRRGQTTQPIFLIVFIMKKDISIKFHNALLSAQQMKTVLGGLMNCCVGDNCSGWCGTGQHCSLVGGNACCTDADGTVHNQCANISASPTRR